MDNDDFFTGGHPFDPASAEGMEKLGQMIQQAHENLGVMISHANTEEVKRISNEITEALDAQAEKDSASPTTHRIDHIFGILEGMSKYLAIHAADWHDDSIEELGEKEAELSGYAMLTTYQMVMSAYLNKALAYLMQQRETDDIVSSVESLFEGLREDQEKKNAGDTTSGSASGDVEDGTNSSDGEPA